MRPTQQLAHQCLSSCNPVTLGPLWTTNLPPNLVFIVGAHASGIVEQGAGKGGGLPTVRTVTTELDRLLTVDHALGVTGGGGEMRAVGHHSCCSEGEGG